MQVMDVLFFVYPVGTGEKVEDHWRTYRITIDSSSKPLNHLKKSMYSGASIVWSKIRIFVAALAEMPAQTWTLSMRLVCGFNCFSFPIFAHIVCPCLVNRMEDLSVQIMSTKSPFVSIHIFVPYVASGPYQTIGPNHAPTAVTGRMCADTFDWLHYPFVDVPCTYIATHKHCIA